MTALNTVAELMEIAAVTAPKTRGDDYVVIEIVSGEDLQALGEAMLAHAESSGITGFKRDGNNVLASGAVVLIGLKDAAVADLNCGACGEETCVMINTHEGEFNGPQCALRVLDMGIALGSAVKTASLMNVDNRIMYRVGVLARELALVDADFVMGIPLSVAGKSIYFDRG
jgi:uncharacterized ferredoxin-like protein